MFAALARTMFGTHSERVLKTYRRRVEQINALEPAMQALSDTELAAQTAKFRTRLQGGETLDQILPEAFATAREASRRRLGLRPFDVQLMGGMALHEGYIPEMRTGEGKTLVATLPVYLNALEGKGVHVVTVNDYLAQRDAEWMSPIYTSLGLSLGVIVANLSDEERQSAYGSDVTYGTNNEFGFDYLRDNMKFRLEDMVQRPFNFAIVDEVDSILIDEARTPLIISGQAQDSAELYRSVNALIPKLEPQDFELDEKHKSVVLTDIGNEHIEEILREGGLLTEGGLYDAANISLVHHVNQALRAHKNYSRDVDYIVKDDSVIIIDEFTGRMMEGRRYSEGLHQALEAKEGVKIQHENQVLASITFQNYFRMYPKLAGMTGTAMTEKDEFEAIYNLRVIELPTNLPQIRYDQHDEIYRTAEEKYAAIIQLAQDCHERGQPVLVGTTSIDKSEKLAKLLKREKIPHNVLNARYHEQEAQIISQAGKPGAITIATNMAGRGTDIKLGGNVDVRIADEIPADADELTRARMEAQIRAEVAEAAEAVKQAGGLYVVGSERHESRRIDNQLRGRSGRQGDPGASKFYISLEDDLMRIFGSEKMDTFLQRMGLKPGQPIIHPWINAAIERAQKKVEGQHFEYRKNILKFDNVMNDQRRVIYEQRREVMNAADVSDVIEDMRGDVISAMVTAAIPQGAFPEQWDMQLLKTDTQRLLGLSLPVDEWAKEEGIDAEAVETRLRHEIDSRLAEKKTFYEPEKVRNFEKGILLQLLDQTWKEHLLDLEHLRQGIYLRAIGQKDPLNEYKYESFALFEGMLIRLREKVTSTVCLVELHADTQAQNQAQHLSVPKPKMPQHTILSRGAEMPEVQDTEPKPYEAPEFNQNDPATWSKTPRNAPCPCGSGKKYKYCHGQSG
ncbi:MAG: preprotein translocase subunit SecA [Alphaproteobacteria bacterium]|nr:preprotein translocase subunit SecA [Alphaproteobacteria bacterium]